MSETTELAFQAWYDLLPHPALPEQFLKTDRHRAMIAFAAGFEVGQGPTPLQAAALAALMRWREVGLAFDRTNFDSWPDWHEQWEASEEALRTTADALLAADGGTG